MIPVDRAALRGGGDGGAGQRTPSFSSQVHALPYNESQLILVRLYQYGQLKKEQRAKTERKEGLCLRRTEKSSSEAL